MAAKIPTPKKIYGHGWILSGEEKMSKSKGNILDPIDIINTYGLDPFILFDQRGCGRSKPHGST